MADYLCSEKLLCPPGEILGWNGKPDIDEVNRLRLPYVHRYLPASLLTIVIGEVIEMGYWRLDAFLILPHLAETDRGGVRNIGRFSAELTSHEAARHGQGYQGLLWAETCPHHISQIIALSCK